MNTIKQYAFSACAAMVACGITRMLLPEGGMQKVFSVTVSVFFLSCLISPAAVQISGLSLDISDANITEAEERARTLQSSVENNAEKIAVEEIKKNISAFLNKMGIKHTSATINIIINGQNDVVIEAADITLAKEYEIQHRQIREQLEDYLGFPVRIGYMDTPQDMGKSEDIEKIGTSRKEENND